MIFNFRMVGLSENKIALNVSIINTSAYTFYSDETKSTRGGAVSSFTKREDLNISLGENLQSTFIEVNLFKKKIFICTRIINICIC